VEPAELEEEERLELASFQPWALRRAGCLVAAEVEGMMSGVHASMALALSQCSIGSRTKAPPEGVLVAGGAEGVQEVVWSGEQAWCRGIGRAWERRYLFAPARAVGAGEEQVVGKEVAGS
jgi:hypothetical protein